MSGAVWNTSKSLADTWTSNQHGNHRSVKELRAKREAELRANEVVQLEWTPEPGRIPYAGWEPDED